LFLSGKQLHLHPILRKIKYFAVILEEAFLRRFAIALSAPAPSSHNDLLDLLLVLVKDKLVFDSGCDTSGEVVVVIMAMAWWARYANCFDILTKKPRSSVVLMVEVAGESWCRRSMLAVAFLDATHGA
jgi:hypothetical protein